MKVLLVAYYFEPFASVSAKRMTYWAQNLNKFDVECHVITSIPQEESKPNVTVVPDDGSAGLLGKLIKDQGLTWRKKLIEHFNNHPTYREYSYVIFSGGPFMHFSVAQFLQRKFGMKTILDYRDPFSNNPRHNSGFLKKTVQSYLEKKFNKSADLVISVNQVCANHINTNKKVEVIMNGYDETRLNQIGRHSDTIKGRLINTGKLYQDFSVVHLLEVIHCNNDLSFEQIGEQSELVDAYQSDRLRSFDFIPYDSMLNRIQEAEIAVLMTGGKPFESPTKLFDYIAMNKKILVITQGEKNTGAIQDVLLDYPNVRWARNTENEIEDALRELLKAQLQDYDHQRCSRFASLQKLVEKLKAL